MCGILGCINFKFSPESLKAISHRGPDGDGIYETTVGSHQVTLAHRRLSIVDVSDNGRQPMQASELPVFITFNGEIYNHQDLKTELSDVTFRGHSDTETLVNFFARHNPIAHLHRLNGIFGFALLDEAQQKLYLIRDRFGVKPVYYHLRNNQLAFSSELRGISHYVALKHDKEKVIEGMKMRYVAAPATIYKDVYKVEPGQVIVFDLSGETIQTSYHYYTQPQPTGSVRREKQKLINEYGDLFEKAVERQLMSDVEIGVLLSAGVDSALVAAVARNKSVKPLKTFTVGFEEGLFADDEIAGAAITAKTLDLPHYHTRVEFSDFVNQLKEIIRIVEEPIATNSIIPMYWLSKLASQQVKVVLSGQGADEPLYGYRKYKGLKILEPVRRSSFLRTGMRLSGMGSVHKEDVRRLYTAAQEKDLLNAYRAFNAISSEKELEEMSGTSLRTMLRDNEQWFRRNWESRLPSKKATISFPYLDLRTSLADDLLMYSDKLMMHFGVECRVPILDNDLIAFIESLHPDYKFSFRKGKLIHKAFAEEYLPASIVHRKKIGFATPASSWYNTYHQEITDIICGSATIRELFDVEAIRRLLTEHRRNQNREKQILLLLSLSLNQPA